MKTEIVSSIIVGYLAGAVLLGRGRDFLILELDHPLGGLLRISS